MYGMSKKVHDFFFIRTSRIEMNLGGGYIFFIFSLKWWLDGAPLWWCLQGAHLSGHFKDRSAYKSGAYKKACICLFVPSLLFFSKEIVVKICGSFFRVNEKNMQK